MKKQKVSPKATVGQVRGVSEMLRGRRCRASQGGIGIEVRGTSRFEVIDEMIADLRVMSKKLNILLIYVDPAIYDATK